MRFAFLLFTAEILVCAQTQNYQDPQKRFAFSYPSEFGASSAGTDDGFGDRVAAVRFSAFSAGVHAGKIIFGAKRS